MPRYGRKGCGKMQAKAYWPCKAKTYPINPFQCVDKATFDKVRRDASASYNLKVALECSYYVIPGKYEWMKGGFHHEV